METEALPKTTTRVETARRSFDLNGPLPGVIALACCGYFAATLAPITDHAYQFYQAERILDGARMYVDVGAADMHPPLFTWLAVAIAAFGRLIGISGLTLYPLVVLTLMTLSLWGWWRFAPRSGFVLASLVFALLPFSGPYYGQGEQLALMLSLPYLAAAGAAASGRSLTRPASLGVAVLAGFGLAMKPHFVLVWLGVEGYVAVRRGLRSLLRTECVVIGTIFVCYVVATALLAPEFFELLPWLARLYPNVAPASIAQLILDPRSALLLVAAAACFILRKDDVWRHIAILLAITATAMYAAMLLQGKGWGYHWYPVSALAVVLAAIALRPWAARVAVLTPALAAAAVLWMPRQSVNTARYLATDPTELPDMMDLVERHARGGSIVALTYYLEVGFPLVNFSGVGWASPYGHLWMVPAFYPAAWRGRPDFRYRDVGEWRDLEQQMFERVWEQIERHDPAITLIDRPLNSGFDMRAYFETDARFRDRFARSPVIDTIGRYIILGRPQASRTASPPPGQ
jgi:hypothetical protein